MKSLELALNEYNKCTYKKEKFGGTHIEKLPYEGE
jgi:hypothetical protein